MTSVSSIRKLMTSVSRIHKLVFLSVIFIICVVSIVCDKQIQKVLQRPKVPRDNVDNVDLPVAYIKKQWLSVCHRDSGSSAPVCIAWASRVELAIQHMLDFLTPSRKYITPNNITNFDAYEPFWNCGTRERIPSIRGDGPKWICGLDLLNGRKSAPLVYSFGSNGDTQFEQAMRVRVPKSEIVIFDPTLNYFKKKKVREENFKLVEIGLGGLGSKNFTSEKKRRPPINLPLRSLIDHQAALGHTDRPISVLKVDIEGSEYKSFRDISIGTCTGADVVVDQLLIEMHGNGMKPLFQKLYSCGMFLFSKERNHWGCSGYRCVEFSFVGPETAFEDFKGSQYWGA